MPFVEEATTIEQPPEQVLKAPGRFVEEPALAPPVETVPSLRQAPEPSLTERAIRTVEPYLPDLLLESLGRIPAPQGEKALRALVEADALSQATGVFVHPSAAYRYQKFIDDKAVNLTASQAQALQLKGDAWDRVNQAWEFGARQDYASELAWAYTMTGDEEKLTKAQAQMGALPGEANTFIPRTVLEESTMWATKLVPMIALTAREGGMKALGIGMIASTTALIARRPDLFLPAWRGAFMVGGIEGTYEAVTRKEGGGAVLNMLQAGIDPKVARALAVPYGLTAGAMEFAQLKLLLRTVPGASQLMQSAIVEAAALGTVKDRLLSLGKEFAVTLTQETGIELMQQSTEILHTEIAKIVSNKLTGTDIPPTTMNQILAELRQVTNASVKGFGALMVPPMLLRAGHAMLPRKAVPQAAPEQPVMQAVEEAGARVEGVVRNERGEPAQVIVTDPVSGTTFGVPSTDAPAAVAQVEAAQQSQIAKPSTETAQAMTNLEPIITSEADPSDADLGAAFDQAQQEPAAPPVGPEAVAPGPIEQAVRDVLASPALQAPEVQAAIQETVAAVQQTQPVAPPATALLPSPESGAPTTAQADERAMLESVALHDALTAARTPDEAYPALRDLSRAFYTRDMTEADFTERVREALGDLVSEPIEGAMPRAFQSAQALFEKLGEERGSLFGKDLDAITRRIQQSADQVSDQVLNRLRKGEFPKPRELYGPSLFEMLREEGGVQDQGGELSHMDVDGTRKPFQKKLIQEQGLTLERATERAVEAGYLHEQDINAFLDLLREEARGVPQYAIGQENQAAVTLNQTMEQVQRALEESGIDIHKATNEAIKLQLNYSSLRDALKRAEKAAKEAYRAGKKEGIAAAESKVNEIKESIKARIRQATGQVKGQELTNLKFAFIKAARAARAAYRAGNTAGVATEKAKIAAILERKRNIQAIREGAVTLKKLQKKATGRIAVDYQQKLKDLMAGIDLATPTEATLTRLRGLADFVQREGVPLGLTQVKINQLARLTQFNFRDLSPAARVDLVETAKEIYQAGLLKQQLTESRHQRDVARHHEALIEATVNLDPEVSGERPLTKADTFKVGLRHAELNALHTFRVANRLDGLRDYQGPNARMIVEEMHAEIAAKNEARTRIHRLITGMQRLGLEEVSDTMSQRINVVLMAEQGARGQTLALLQAYEMEAIPTLTPTELAVVHLVRQVVGEHTDAIAQLYEARETLPFVRVERYFPIKYEGEFNLAPSSTIAQDRYRTRQVPQGFTQERQPYVEDIPRQDFLAVAEEAILDQEWYLQMQPVLDRHAELTRTPQYKEAAGELGWNWWKDQLDIVARNGWMATARANPALRTMRVNLNQAILGYKLSSLAMQPFAVFDATAVVLTRWGPEAAKDVLTEFTKAWLNPKAALAYVEQSPALSLRQAGEVAIEEVLEASQGFKGLRRKFVEHSLTGLRTADVITAAGVQRGLARILRKHGLTEQAALAEAEFLMNVLSGSSEVTIRPHVLATGEIARTWFTFQTFFLNRWGIISEDILRQGFAGDWTRKASALLAVALMTAAGAAEDETRDTVYEFMTGQPGHANDEALWSKVVLYLPRQIPVVGSLFETWGRAEPPLLRTIGQITSGAKQVAGDRYVAGGSNILEGILSAFVGVPGTAQFFDLLSRITEEERKQERREQQRERRFVGTPGSF